jgi:N-acetylneuraminic acid mutarotase
LPEPRSRYALAVFEGQLYLFGGWDGKLCRQDVFVYNPASQQWSKGNAMPTARCNAGAAVVGNRIYVIGGEDAGAALRANERFDPANGQWEGAAPLTAAVAQPAVVGFSGIVNLALVFDPQTRQIYKYNPNPEGWTTESVPDSVMLSSRATDIGTSVFMFGGTEGDKPGALNEYKAIFTSFLPNTSFDQSTPAP